MSAVLREAPRQNTQALSKIFNHLNKLDKLETDVIGLLPDLSDDEVMETRNYAKLLGKSAWKIECACDAEIWNRTKAMCGRGNKDVDRPGGSPKWNLDAVDRALAQRPKLQPEYQR